MVFQYQDLHDYIYLQAAQTHRLNTLKSPIIEYVMESASISEKFNIFK